MDDQIAKDDELPDTGIGLEWERIVSSIFVKSETYGTRSTTLMMRDATGRIRIDDRFHVPKQKPHTYEFTIEP